MDALLVEQVPAAEGDDRLAHLILAAADSAAVCASTEMRGGSGQHNAGQQSRWHVVYARNLAREPDQEGLLLMGSCGALAATLQWRTSCAQEQCRYGTAH